MTLPKKIQKIIAKTKRQKNPVKKSVKKKRKHNPKKKIHPHVIRLIYSGERPARYFIAQKSSGGLELTADIHKAFQFINAENARKSAEHLQNAYASELLNSGVLWVLAVPYMGRTREDNPTRFRLIHTTADGARVWRDAEWNEYRYAPPGVGPRGTDGNDKLVGFTDDKQDAIASANAITRQKNPHERYEALIWFKGKETHMGYMPGHYYLAESREDHANAIAQGGTDVSGFPEDWRAFERQMNDDYMSP